jgi:uncharacterized phiE125 gp8 family phage protein
MKTEISQSANEPVSLAEAKGYLKVDHADDDVLIGRCITAARLAAEGITGRIIAQRDFRIDVTGFGNGVLPLSPVSSVASVKYLDSNKQLQILSGLDFCPHPLSPQLFPPSGGWPAVCSAWNAVQIICTAGMNPVPEDIQSWILLRIATAYEQRSALVDSKFLTDLPRTYVDALLDAYTVVRL